MSHSIRFLHKPALFAALLLLPAAALAFNPQPDPPGKRKQQTKSLGGPDTKSKGKGSWKSIHEVDEKSKSKGGWKSFHEVDKRKSK